MNKTKQENEKKTNKNNMIIGLMELLFVAKKEIRPVRLLRVLISEGLTQADS